VGSVAQDSWAAALAVRPEQVLAQAGSENFPVALRLLPAAPRRHLRAIYAYARLVDDVGDGALTSDAAIRGALLDVLDADLTRVWSGEPHLPVLRRVQQTVRACGLRPEPFRALLAAGRADLSPVHCRDWDDLQASCRLSADPVGRLVLGVFGADTREREALSDRICTALQVLEHCQDVAEDARRGSVYLPADLLASHAVAEADLTAAAATAGLRAAVGGLVGRARDGLGAGATLVHALKGPARLAIAGFVGGGLATADALEAARFDPLSAAVKPSRARSARHALRLLARPADRSS
jgi:squalene synthase HpnC